MGDPEGSDSRIRVLHAASTEQRGETFSLKRESEVKTDLHLPEALSWVSSEISRKGLPNLLDSGGYSIMYEFL